MKQNRVHCRIMGKNGSYNVKTRDQIFVMYQKELNSTDKSKAPEDGCTNIRNMVSMK